MEKPDKESSNTMDIPTRYDAKTNETKWQSMWEKKQIYRFNWDDRKKPSYTIDTPPPYPSGEFHMGNALNWCYFDFIARYKRMRGYNVQFPQGWDCHGLPTEVRAETTHKIKKNDLPIHDFMSICRKLTNEYIQKMKKTMKGIGYSIHWSLEYKTMDPNYYKLTQLSFILLYHQKKLYQGEHPVNWCPRCETAIAEAEVEYTQREGSLYYINFQVNGEDVVIATTRPELLAAIVAVAIHPSDTRYARLKGRMADVPLFNKKVPVIVDEEVDLAFGTGVVMVCTFGDKTDVRWQNRHNLPIITILTEDGRLIKEAGKYAGLTIPEGKKKIADDLNAKNLIQKKEKISQNIGTCWRCHTPIEILSRKQWFMKTRDMTDQVIEWTNKISWIPEFSKNRMIDWATSLDWDWVISRQRIFGTPIPVWYCQECGKIVIPEEKWLPIDPRFENPPVSQCSRCGSRNFKGENDVMDTWMDSSITSAVHCGWPKRPHAFKRLYPSDLQPNGLDIIRTWDYYLMVKHLALFGKPPYRTVLINGMVRGIDGRMMHKSYGNYVEALEVLEKYGADALRQWAAGGAVTGYDIPFNWSDIEYGKKFLTKLWNASRFILLTSGAERDPKPVELLDTWILSKMESLIQNTIDAFEKFQFNAVIDMLRKFIWHDFCDQYLEAVKYRLYSSNTLDVETKKRAQCTLNFCLKKLLILLAPICPHIAETIYQMMKNKKMSVHLEKYPIANSKLINKDIEAAGDFIIEVIATIRRIKAEKRIALKTSLSNLEIVLDKDYEDLCRKNIEVIKRISWADNVKIIGKNKKDLKHPITVSFEVAG
ncbi:valine--tRNA ligase [[Eubacterium] cellulosolvens]